MGTPTQDMHFKFGPREAFLESDNDSVRTSSKSSDHVGNRCRHDLHIVVIENSR